MPPPPQRALDRPPRPADQQNWFHSYIVGILEYCFCENTWNCEKYLHAINSIAPVGGDLYVLSEEEAVRTARYPEVVQVVLAPPPLARPAPALAWLRGLQREVNRLAKVYQLQARLRPDKQAKND